MRNQSVDIVLINPYQGRRIYQSLDKDFTGIEPPIWCGLIASYAMNKGLVVKIIDANALKLSSDEVAEIVSSIKCSLVVLVAYGHNPSASTQTMPAIIEIAKDLICAGYRNKTLLVGGHIAALPEQSLRETNLDFACLGEGPNTVVKMAEILARNGTNFDDVPDLLYVDEAGILIRTRTSGLIRNLDEEMPGVAWDLLPMDLYRCHGWHSFTNHMLRQPYASLYTSLGCPYFCNFCVINAPFQYGKPSKTRANIYRMWSADSIIREIDILVQKYRVHNIKFADEIFLLNRTHVREICSAIIARGYDLNIWAYARVDFDYDEEILRLMRRAGIKWLCLGIESGSSRVRTETNKDFSHQYLFEAVDKIRAADICIIGNYIFGLPEDDLDSMQETLNLAKELNCEFVNMYSASAYPGSALYLQALAKKWPLPISWEGYAQLAPNMLPLPTNHISGQEVLAFRDRAFVEYFTNPVYIESVQSKFGDQAVNHIHKMLLHKLERVTIENCRCNYNY